MHFHYKLKHAWQQLIILIIILAPQLSLLIVSAVTIDQLDASGIADSSNINKIKLQQTIASICFFAIPALIFSVLVVHNRQLALLGFRKPEQPAMLPLSAIGIILSLPLVFWLGEINAKIPLPEGLTKMEDISSDQLATFLKADHVGDILINLLVLAVFPAICEEMLFRGAIQRVMIFLTKNAWIGIIVSAAIFSALHFQFAGFLPRMFLGVLLGIFYWYSGSLWVPVFAHFVNNALQVIAASYAPEFADTNPSVPVLAAVVSGVITLYIVYLFRKKSTTDYNKVYHIPEDQY